LDLPSILSAILVIAIVAVGLMAIGIVMNLVSFAKTRRPSELGVRLMLAMPGLAMVLVAIFGFFLFILAPELGTPGSFATFVFGLVLGSLFLVGALRARVSTVRAEAPRSAPDARRAVRLLAIYLLPVGALELWGALSTRNNFRIGVATVSLASALVLLGVFAYARAVKLQSPLRFGSLDGSSVYLAFAMIMLIGTLFFLTSLPDKLP
jgi:hypothetical protein